MLTLLVSASDRRPDFVSRQISTIFVLRCYTDSAFSLDTGLLFTADSGSSQYKDLVGKHLDIARLHTMCHKQPYLFPKDSSLSAF
jgi:hypothetical protein